MFGLYANSSEAYWSDINLRVRYKLSDLVQYIDTWNESSLTWNRISENSQLFRLLFN